MRKKTIYTVVKTSNGKQSQFTGTLDYLVDNVFGYTIECNGKRKTTARRSLAGLLGCLNGGTSYWSINSVYYGEIATPKEMCEECGLTEYTRKNSSGDYTCDNCGYDSQGG